MRQQAKSGFTLVEMMVAGAIFLLFCTGFFSAYISAMRAQRMATNHYRALCLARNRIQHARATEYSSLDLLAETNAAVDAYGNADPAGNFQRATIIEPSTNTTADISQFTVRIWYPVLHGRLSATPVEQSTLISNPM